MDYMAGPSLAPLPGEWIFSSLQRPEAFNMMAMEFADHALIRRWQAGDPAAFEALVRRWEGPVARFLDRMLSGAAPIEDAAQEVFLRVYRAGPGYRPQAAFSTWLFQIAVNVARDALRRERRRAPVSDVEPIDDAEPWSVAEARETVRLVAQALAELPEELRVVLVLRHYQGLSFAEIGRICAAPASTVKSRFAAALARLRPLLRRLKPDLKETEP
jgi:RNA polymerase sigma-70 factor (ECF subfamily)